MKAKVTTKKTNRPYEADIPENAKAINEQTFRMKEKLWFSSLGENMTTVRYGKDVKELDSKFAGRPALVIGAGPSITNHNQLETVAKSGFKGIIVACDKILKPCLVAGIVPQYVVSTDGDPEIAEFFTNIPSIAQPSVAVPDVILNAITAHPRVVNELKIRQSEIYWFISFIDDPNQPRSLTRAIYYMTNKTMLQSLGNVGGTAWHMALFMGCDPVGMIGLDYGYPGDTKIEDTIYYKAYVNLVGKDHIAQCFRKVKNPDTGKEVLVDLNWDVYRQIFTTYSPLTKVKTYNCSPESSLFGPGISYKPLEEFLRAYTKQP